MLVQKRGLKYFRQWYKLDYLHDYWNLSQGKPSHFEIWKHEGDSKNGYKSIKYLDTLKLPRYLRARLDSECIPAQYTQENEIEYKRRLFGLYGIKSGVDPIEIFYSKAQKEEEKEIDEFVEGNLIKFIEDKDQKSRTEVLKVDEKMKLLRERLDKLPQELEKFYAKQEKETARIQEIRKNQQNILEMARDKFGFNLKVNDPKFRQFREEYLEEQKVAKKKASKQVR